MPPSPATAAAAAGLLCIAAACTVALWLYCKLWLRPNRIRALLREQGIGGPPPAFPSGNLAETRRLFAAAKQRRRDSRAAAGTGGIEHDYRAALFPHYEKWRKEYGAVFSYQMGGMVMLHVGSPEMVKEMSLCVSPELGKGSYLKRTHAPLLGDGILKSNGPSWARQRKLIAPELSLALHRLGPILRLISGAAVPLLRSWSARVLRSPSGAAEFLIDDDLRSVSADVISRECFGPAYAARGREIFAKLRLLQSAVSKPDMVAETFGFRYTPTRRNREAWRLRSQVRALILDIVRAGGEQTTLLHAILCNATGEKICEKEAERMVVDNCKNIYFAGYESTAVTAVWCLMLLALHPEWQHRARAEVREVFGAAAVVPDAQSLQKMKILTAVIMETLRLYPPGAYVSREPMADMTIGGVRVPKGVNIYIPVATLHLDAELWGDDAQEFKPERFAGAGRPAPPHGYLPFGAGARTCLGQAFAMAEIKVLLMLILDKFSFTLSPAYVHSPVLKLIIEPEFGVSLVVRMAEQQ